MSIQNLTQPNDYKIWCDTMTCNNLIPGQIVNSNAIYRLNIDPTSNPDPLSGGLIVTSTETNTFNFALPLTDNQTGLGLASTIKYDPHNHLTFNGTQITCNKEGNYSISIQLDILSNIMTANNYCIAQATKPGDSIFSNPPAVSAASNFISITGTPIGGVYNIASILAANSITHLNVNDQLDLKFYLAYDTCVVALTSCLCINEL